MTTLIWSGLFLLLLALTSLLTYVLWWQWQFKRLARSRQWPRAEAIIQSAQLEVIGQARGTALKLPVCAFSYSVGGRSYSGRFSLVPASNPEEFPVSALLHQKLPLQYDPIHPENWQIPLDHCFGCSLEQRMGNPSARRLPGG
jgi:hypothetical protein